MYSTRGVALCNLKVSIMLIPHGFENGKPFPVFTRANIQTFNNLFGPNKHFKCRHIFLQATHCSTLFATLANDQADFVELLLRKELKVDVTTFINVCTLQTLYSNVSRQSSTALLYTKCGV